MIDSRLLQWAQGLPSHQQPQPVDQEILLATPIPMYQSSCDNYPSCQIANLWNMWRSQRLVLVKIVLTSLQVMLEHSSYDPSKMEEYQTYQVIFQDLVDSVCRSIPFHMGNRTHSLRLSDFNDPALVILPEYSTVASDATPGHATAEEDPRRAHIIARGPWHIMSPLSHLLTLLSEDGDEQIASILRHGQLGWLRAQFIRVATVMNLPFVQNSEWSDALRIGEDGVDHLARCFREGAAFLSGL